jgi:class 3 adenylate cyclase/tetratricopeptide (TPR) repeat protein
MIVCPACGNENPAGARFCNACGQPLAAATDVREERKVVTIVFADLVGSTARAESLDPEDVRLLLSTYHSRVRHELAAHGGTVEKFIGDAVVAVFGAPTSHEDDPERAVRAALAIQDAIAELNEAQPALELEVRIGVNTGEALVALEARPEAGEGMVSGDVINTAARLQSAAPPGGVLVGEQTHRATDRVIDYAEHDPIAAKGKAEPVAAWLAVGRRSSFGVEDIAVGRAPLVGREREVTLLADALIRVRRDERPQLITLVGVPGIGKSRLVQELRELVDAAPELITWRRGRSLPYGEGVAYWALGEIVKAQAGILESDHGETASEKASRMVADLVSDRTEGAWLERQLRPLVGLPGAEGSPSRDEAFAAWRRLLEALAEERPTVLVFEDLHWADDDLLDFVDQLVDDVDAVPLLLVCTARPELLSRRPDWGGGKLNALTLSLAPLSSDETARLLASLLERSVLPAETQAKLIERAAGVPLFAEEYVRMLESGDAAQELPDTLQGLVAARIDGLPPGAKELLQDAAVLGKVFWSDALGDLASLDGAVLDERLRLLERQEFVRRERRSAVEGARQYVFLHAIVREAAYGQIPRAARSLKHRRTAEWIAALPPDRGEDRAETLAHHLESAMSYGRAAGIEVDDLRPLLARALREAGDRARSLNIVSRSAAYYRRALDEGPEEHDAELAWLYGEASMWAEGVEGGQRPLEDACTLLLAAGLNGLAAQAMTLLDRALWEAGRLDPTLLDRALELIAGLGPTLQRGRVISAVALRWAIAGRAAEALPLALEALEIARAHGDLDAEAEALNNVAVSQVNGGDLEGGLITAQRCLALALECGARDLPRPYINLATFEYDMGNLEAAERYHREGLDLAERFGKKGAADWLEAELTIDRFELGHWDEALRDARHLADGRSERGALHYLDPFLRFVEAKIVLAREGRLPDGLVDAVLARARSIGDPQLLGPALGEATALWWRTGNAEMALGCLGEYRDMMRSGTAVYAGGPHVVSCVVAWLELSDKPVPDELLVGPVTEWTRAAALVSQAEPVAAADLLSSIGARAIEADVRLHAAQQCAASGPLEAEQQLQLAAAFWQSVGATARLAMLDDVRRLLRSAAS